MAKRNVHTSSRLDDFLKEEGFFEEVQTKALKRALAEQLEESMQAAELTKLDISSPIRVGPELKRQSHFAEPPLTK